MASFHCLALAKKSLLHSSPYPIHSILVCCLISEMHEEIMAAYLLLHSFSCCWSVESLGALYRSSCIAKSCGLTYACCVFKSPNFSLLSLVSIGLSRDKNPHNCCILLGWCIVGRAVDTMFWKLGCVHHMSQNRKQGLGLENAGKCINKGVWSDSPLGRSLAWV